jgi:hypothetical protein
MFQVNGGEVIRIAEANGSSKRQKTWSAGTFSDMKRVGENK